MTRARLEERRKNRAAETKPLKVVVLSGEHSDAIKRPFDIHRVFREMGEILSDSGLPHLDTPSEIP